MKIKNLILLLVAFIATSFIFTACNEEIPVPNKPIDSKDTVEVDNFCGRFRIYSRVDISFKDTLTNQPIKTYFNGVQAYPTTGTEYYVPKYIQVNGIDMPIAGGGIPGQYEYLNTTEYLTKADIRMEFYDKEYTFSAPTLNEMSLVGINPFDTVEVDPSKNFVIKYNGGGSNCEKVKLTMLWGRIDKLIQDNGTIILTPEDLSVFKKGLNPCPFRILRHTQITKIFDGKEFVTDIDNIYGTAFVIKIK